MPDKQVEDTSKQSLEDLEAHQWVPLAGSRPQHVSFVLNVFNSSAKGGQDSRDSFLRGPVNFARPERHIGPRAIRLGMTYVLPIEKAHGTVGKSDG
jgi:hypothetical protein